MKTPLLRKEIVFGNADARLAGRVFLPSADRPLPAAILCHGFGSSKKVMEPCARALASHGIASLIFDFRGHGESGGSIDGLPIQDVLAAHEFLCRRPEIDTERTAIIGHSLGAMTAIFAASELKPRALVLLSCPPETSDEFPTNGDTSSYGHWGQDRIMEYPRHGALPWLNGIAAIACRLWMAINGFSVRVNWQKFLAALRETRMSSALEKLDECAKLFVFCLGDRVTPYRKSVLVYETAPAPKEVLVMRGGNHTAPLSRKCLRASWLEWTADNLRDRR
jgi:pimeloyl-ACP methyl ester carboxylesterase